MHLLTVCFCLLTLIMANPANGQPPTKFTFIYVKDFELDAENVHEGAGILSHRPGRSGPMARSRSLGNPERDQGTNAREMVELMSNSIVRDLKNLGYDARRLAPDEPLPETGMLVRGLFANVDEGNRLRRAVIGLGVGRTDLQVIVSVSPLGKDDPDPFYDINTGAQRGKMPGAIITLNPYAAAAKFVLAGKDMKKGIIKTASKVASAIDKQIQTPATGSAGANVHPLPESKPDR